MRKGLLSLVILGACTTAGVSSNDDLEDTGSNTDDTDIADTDTDDTDTDDTDTDDTDTDTDVPTEPCEGVAICDDFEADSAGGHPNATHWEVVTPNCSGDGVVAVDSSVSHSGSNSVKVTSSGGYCNHIFIAPKASVADLGSTVHGRFWVRFGQTFGWEHITFLAMKDSVEGRDLRMGGQSQIMMWNRESDDATLPELSPTGIDMSWAPPEGSWHCVQFVVDGAAGTLETWVDEDRIEGLIVDGDPTPDVDSQWLRKPEWRPKLIDAKFGWEGYGGGASQIWFDDIALDSKPIGCAM